MPIFITYRSFSTPSRPIFFSKRFLPLSAGHSLESGSLAGLSIHPGLLLGMETLEQSTDTQA